MRERRAFSLLAVIIAVLLMSVAYAAIQDVTLNVTGNVTVTPDQSNFKVTFTGTPTSSGRGTATLKITGDTTATMNVSGLTAAGDTLTAKFTIANTSTDLAAYLSCSATNTNTTYFSITPTLNTTELKPNTSTTLNVTVKLIKTPTSSSQTTTINVSVIASPAEVSTGNTISIVSESNGLY